MAIKRLGLFVLMAALTAGGLAAQWRDEVNRLFSRGKNYKAVVEAVLPAYDTLVEADKPDAAALLAFCYARQSDAAGETRWIVEYFETGKGKDSGFVFLDFLNQTDILGYLNVWKMRYPFVSEISLVKGVGNEVIIPQGLVPLVIDISGEAFYKFSLGGNILEAGQFKSGFNVLGLDAAELFLNPGRRTYLLELKSGSLVLRKEIELNIEVTSPLSLPKPAPPPGRGRPIEYSLSMYVGGELVMTSRKTETPVSWKLDVPVNTLNWGWNPNDWINRDKPDPMRNSIDIVRAVSAIYDLIKELFKKKNKNDPEPPKIQTVQDLSLVFPQKDPDGKDREMRVSLRLRTKNLPYVLNPS
jgi:hypothetical protein